MNSYPISGLYGLKPWYATRLARVRRVLVTKHVNPDAITLAGVAFGAAAGCALATLHHGPLAAVVVAALLAARLACANLDGGVARDRGLTNRFGVVANELGDRAAELAALAGCLALAPSGLVAAAALAATLPSWIALAGVAASLPRIQGGPVGKTERCLLLVLIAATGAAAVVLVIMAVGSSFTAVVRLARIWTRTREPAPSPDRTHAAGTATTVRSEAKDLKNDPERDVVTVSRPGSRASAVAR
jgi:CDP-diacylglycerol--glycerol-3-phosphate 3-phosphatidyltransferase